MPAAKKTAFQNELSLNANGKLVSAADLS